METAPSGYRLVDPRGETIDCWLGAAWGLLPEVPNMLVLPNNIQVMGVTETGLYGVEGSECKLELWIITEKEFDIYSDNAFQSKMGKNIRLENSNRKYQALGTFLEAFELMIDRTRRDAASLIPHKFEDRALIDILLHHEGMTAYRLVTTLRALYVETLSRLGEYGGFHDSNRLAIFKECLAALCSEVKELSELRNSIVHGTIFVSSDEEDLHIFKNAISADGIKPNAKVPQTVSALNAITQRCRDAEHVLVWLNHAFFYREEQTDFLLDKFTKKSDKWHRITTRGLVPIKGGRSTPRQRSER